MNVAETSFHSSTLFVIDSGIADYQTLINGIHKSVDTLILDADQDGIEAITKALSTRSIAQLHLVTHGESGKLQLGGVQLSNESLPRYTAQIRSWANALAANANILLYGCRVAADTAGQALVEQIAQLTGRAVAASSKLVGNEALGGQWELDVHVGQITAELAISPAARAAYKGTLNLTVVSGVNASTLLAKILGNTTGLSNIQATITGASDSFGTFSDDPFGLGSGIVLSTGQVGTLPGPNEVEDAGFAFNGDPEVTGKYDEAVMTITFDAAPGVGKAYFAYAFGSDEFIEFSGSGFNDSFELLVNGENLAKLSDGSDVSVDSLVPDQNDQSTWKPEFIDNSGGKVSQETELDGYTKFMVFEADIQTGANTIVIRVKDVGDNEYDSAVFIKSGSLSVTPPPIPTPPPAPVGLNLVDASDTATPAFGASTTDNKTLDATPTFEGTGRVGDLIKLYSDFEGELGSATVGADGKWSITASVGGADLLVGSHKITAVAVDPNNGLKSTPTAPLDLYIDSNERFNDTTPPAAPAQLDLVSDTTNSFGSQNTTDNDTNTRSATFAGTAEVNSVVTLYSDKGGVIGSVRVGRDGKWKITSSPLQSGQHLITAKAVDQNNNESLISQALNVTIRNVPQKLDLIATSDTGSSIGDNYTADVTPTVTGFAEAGTLVEIFDNTTKLGEVTAAADGKWSFTTNTLTEGTHLLKARAQNKQFGTFDDFSTPLTITIDTTKPGGGAGVAPADLDLIAASDNGVSNTDNVTSIKTPTITGTAEPGSIVTLYSDLDGELGKATTGSDGKWTITVSRRKKMRVGNHSLTAQAVDKAGNTSPVSNPPLAITSLPAVSTPDMTAATDSGTSNTDNITNFKRPAFSGTSDPGNTVELYDENDVLIGAGTADTNGNWTITSTVDFTEGDHKVKAVAKKEGLTSVDPTFLDFTIDFDNSSPTPAPSQPNMTNATDSGTDNTDNITVNAKPTFDGTAAGAGLIIKLYDGATLIGTTTSGTGGVWAITPTASLSLGNHTITATATDVAGNVSSASAGLPITILPVPTVSNPDMVAASDSNINNDNITNVKRPNFSGTTNLGTNTVEILVDGVSQGNATLSGTNWSFTPSTDLNDKAYKIEAIATDTYGNQSAKTLLNFTIDTVAPVAPGKPDLDSSRDSGKFNNDDLTNVNKPLFKGTAESNSTVTIFVDGVSIGTTTANNSGAWSFTPTNALTDGIRQITAKATDRAGNVGSESLPLQVTIDTSKPLAPSAPDLTDASDSGFNNKDNYTKETKPTLTGTAEPNSTVDIFDGATQIGTVTADTTGNWSFTATTTLTEGVHAITTKATDLAGNTSLASSVTSITVDTTAPSVTVNTLLTKDNTPTLTGTFSAADVETLTIAVNGNTYTLGDGKLSASGNDWSLNLDGTTPLIDGSYDITATVTDKAGNVGTESTSKELTVDTTAPNAPSAPIMDATSDTGANNDGITSNLAPEFTGTAEVGSTVKLYDDLGNLMGSGVADGAGNWKIKSNSNRKGTFKIKATATDAAGNTSPVSLETEITIDDTAPVVTVETLLTKDSTPKLVGKVDDVDAIVKVTVSGVEYTATNLNNGNWELADNTISPALADARYEVSVTATDKAGNVGSDPTSQELTVDTKAPIVTVATGVITNDTTPKLTGGVDDPDAVIKISVNGIEYTAQNKRDGTWELADNSINPALNNGVYNITATAIDQAGNTATDTTDQELTINTEAPTVTVNPLITSDKTPKLTGTVSKLDATVELTVNNIKYTATVLSNGTWELADNTIASLPDNIYDVSVKATDKAGNIGTDGTINELVIDTQAPVVTVDNLTTNDSTPKLTGTIDDKNAIIKVKVDGIEYIAINKGDNTWELANDQITSALADGVYNVAAQATDQANNVGFDSTDQELVINTKAPDITVDYLYTGDTTPKLTGTVSDKDAVVKLTVNGIEYTAVNNNGKWELADNQIMPALQDGIYNVIAKAMDKAGNVATDASVQDLVVDTTAPVVTVNQRFTNDSTPQLTGTVDVPDAVIKVTVAGTEYTALNLGNGTWEVKNDAIAALVDGTYDIQATATDKAGNVGIDTTNRELTVDTTAPIITIDRLVTGDGTPKLTGTVDDIDALVKITVNGSEYVAVIDSNGTWALPDNLIQPALATGVYDVLAKATDKANNTNVDGSVDELMVTEPTVSLSLDNASVSENGGTTLITATLSHPADREISVELGFSGTASSSDFKVPTSITIAQGQTSGSISLTAIDDILVEASETIVIDVINISSGATENGLQQVTAIVMDDDTNYPPVAVDVNADITPGTTTHVRGVSATDQDGQIVNYTITTLPTADQGVLFLGNPLVDGTPVQVGQVLQPDQIDKVFFKAEAGFTKSSFTYVATDDKGRISIAPATVTLGQAANLAPDAKDRMQKLAVGKTTRVAQLNATDSDGTIASYTITALPAVNQGKLFLGNPAKDGMAVSVGQVLQPEQISQLFFQSGSKFTSARFAYTVTDDTGALDGTPATVVLSTGIAPSGICLPGLKRKGSGKKNHMDGTVRGDRLRGMAGNDVIRGRGCNDRVEGGRGNDRLFGNSGSDVLQGAIGNDRLKGGVGPDVLLGGGGNDRLNGQADNDILRGGQKRDILLGAAGNDILAGGKEQDFLKGGGGNDKLRGGAGTDKLRGGANNDFLNGERDNDRLGGFQGNDVLRGGLGDDGLWGHGGHDRLRGGHGKDNLYGRAGNDKLFGGLRQDRLTGGAGNDVLVGGNRADLLTSGGGADRFVYTRIGDRGDRITDFQASQDVIDLSRFQTSKPFEKFVKFVQVGAQTQVLFAPDGKFQTLAMLDNVTATRLDASNFIL
jgi:Ca2+-binding RTX toxin-like protein